MNIAKHMESIFVVAASFACVAVFFTTQPPVIEVNVVGPVASQNVSPALHQD